MKINRRQFLLTAAASAPALLGGTKLLAEETPEIDWSARPLMSKVWWNLEEFENKVDFRLGELGVVLSKPGQCQHAFLLHAAGSASFVMPSVFCDAKSAVQNISKDDLFPSRFTLYSGPHYSRLLQICPKNMGFFISTNHDVDGQEIMDLKKIAVERNLAIVIGYRTSRPEPFEYTGPWSLYRASDLVLTTERDEDSPEHLIVSILKNRRGEQFRSFWYRTEGNFVSSQCGAWC